MRARNHKEHRHNCETTRRGSTLCERKKDDDTCAVWFGQSRGGSGGVLGPPAAPEWAIITTLAMTISEFITISRSEYQYYYHYYYY